MYKEKKILALITARGGSKGIPGKNIIPLGDKPLIAWTIEAAKNSKYIDKIILSSDSNEIIKVAQKYGCEVPFKRPEHLALDTTPSMDVILHALEYCNSQNQYDYLLLLQPTSPFRKTTTIDLAIEFCIDNKYPLVVSMAHGKKSPTLMFYESDDNSVIPVLGRHEKVSRRQDLTPVYEHNGAIYFSEIDFLVEKKSYNCPEARIFKMDGYENIDIDTFNDLQYANFLVEKGLL